MGVLFRVVLPKLSQETVLLSTVDADYPQFTPSYHSLDFVQVTCLA